MINILFIFLHLYKAILSFLLPPRYVWFSEKFTGTILQTSRAFFGRGTLTCVCVCVHCFEDYTFERKPRNFLALENMLFFKWYTFLSVSCLSFDGKKPCNCREGSRNINFNSFSLTKLCIKYTTLVLFVMAERESCIPWKIYRNLLPY